MRSIRRWKSKLRMSLEIAALIAFIVVGVIVVLRTTAHSPPLEQVVLPTITPSPSLDQEGLIEARYYTKLDGKAVQCRLCFRRCTIPRGGKGICLVRENREGKLYTLVYGKPVAVHIDPIEKEPMYHMFPGTDTLSLGTAGCNFKCKNCINWHIAFKTPEEVEAVLMSPEEVIQLAIDHGVPTICFTYNDPIVLYEYMYDTAKLAKEKGLKTTFHSNGSLNPEPLKALLKYMDTVVIDLKAFTEEFYRDVCDAELAPVLESLKIIKAEGVWLEIVYLVIPTLNDDMEEIEQMSRWIKEKLGEETPVHFSRFFPCYKLAKLFPTPLVTLEEACRVARKAGLHYVYIQNVPGHKFSNTLCPKCGKILIGRKGFMIMENNIEQGRCKFCGHEIPGLWE